LGEHNRAVKQARPRLRQLVKDNTA
jgi:hypothetical protein